MKSVDICKFFTCKNATVRRTKKNRVVVPGSGCGQFSCLFCEHYSKFSYCVGATSEGTCSFNCKMIEGCKLRDSMYGGVK